MNCVEEWDIERQIEIGAFGSKPYLLRQPDGKTLINPSMFVVLEVRALRLGVICYSSNRRCTLAFTPVRFAEMSVRFDFAGYDTALAHSEEYGSGHAQAVAQGLFYLDLLTPKVETLLGVTITAHQRMEWALERPEITTA